MFDVAASLMPSLARSQRALGAAAAATASAQTPYGSPRTDAAMAAAARGAIFQEALLGAMHARLAELRGVTRNG